MPTKDELRRVQGTGVRLVYDNNSWGTNNPDYIAIAVDTTQEGTTFSAPRYSDKLDPLNKVPVQNDNNEFRLSVPVLKVPAETLELVNSVSTTITNKVTEEDKKTAKDVHAIADKIAKLPNAELVTSPVLDVGELLYGNTTNVSNMGYTPVNPREITAFSSLSGSINPLVTADSVACRPEHIPEIKEPEKIDWRNKELKNILDKFNDSLKDLDIDVPVHSVSSLDITDGTVNGTGVFDSVSQALFSQLNYLRENGLASGNDISTIYSGALPSLMQVSVQFALEKDRAYYQNLNAKAQYLIAQVQLIKTKAELLMFPYQLEAMYADMELKKASLEGQQYQNQVFREQINQTAANTDNIREETALKCVQRKQALENLAQSDLDRKLKQAKIDESLIAIAISEIEAKIKANQAEQAEIATQLALVNLEGAKEDVKSKNAEWQLRLVQVKAAEAQLLVQQAELKLKAQQLLKETENLNLIKAQTATAYAQVSATTEAVRAARAQYSDTIDGEPVGGILGAQIAVNRAQKEAFDRDGYYKYLGLLKDGWAVKKAGDPAVVSPNIFSAISLDRALNFGLQKYFNIPHNIGVLPEGYSDFLTDDEFDGNSATTGTTGRN